MRSLLPLLALAAGGAEAYSAGRLPRPRIRSGALSSSSAEGPAHARYAARAPSSTALDAGLRNLVGEYDGDYYGPTTSIRDARDSAFDRNSNFGSGGGDGGYRPGFGRRNSPGFLGFGRDDYRNRNYPNYDVTLDAPVRGGRGRGARIFDNVAYDDLPGANGRRMGNFGPYNNREYGRDPYDRGLDQDFIGTNGSRRTSRGQGGFNREFDDRPRGLLPGRSSYGRGRGGFGGGRRGNLPQIYQRDYLDTLDGRSFNFLTAVEQYFEAWNRRNIPLALSCFDDDVYYDDTQFSEPFEGKDKLADHILYVADCLPDSFYFVIDELSVGRSQSARRRDAGNIPTYTLGRNRVAQARSRARFDRPTLSISALWHVENEFGQLPFARGCSFFKVDPNTNLIVEAYDFPEPAVIKTGSTGLKFLSAATKLVREPGRWFPFFAWINYVYIVFFSNGILPGKDIFHATPATVREVQDLTFNFLFIAPATNMPTAAKLNPVLEGIFNGLLAWAFMFAGFLSDERSGMGPFGKDSRYYERLSQNQEQVLDNGIVLVPPVSITKKNLISLVPTIVVMQFFLSAALLPYLFCRTSERYSSEIQLVDRGRYPAPRRIRPLYREELDRPALVLGEARSLGIILGLFGMYAIWWGFAGRPAFAPPIWVSDKRMVEFMKLLDKDRISAMFVVDLWVFGIFQGWLVDDDWKRRGRSLDEEKFLRNVAKFFPYFGLAAYLIFRPRFPSNRDGFDYDLWDRRRRGGRGRGGGFGGPFGGDRDRDMFR
ncbi:hypothetical protein ACHAXT_004918 [Thalassiosira profunda]